MLYRGIALKPRWRLLVRNMRSTLLTHTVLLPPSCSSRKVCEVESVGAGMPKQAKFDVAGYPRAGKAYERGFW